MSQFVTNHFVQEYTTNVQLLSQQMGSRFRPFVMSGTHTGEKAVPVDQFAATVAQERTTRYPQLTPVDTQTDRRWVAPRDWDWNDLTDSIDVLRMLIDPTSPMAQNGTAAMMRSMDDVIVQAFFADALTGKTGSTSTSFPSSQQVLVGEGATSATGLNVEKLKAGIEILLSTEAWEPDSGDLIYCAITAAQNRNLMDDVQFINGDYNQGKPVIQQGFVNEWGKVRFIHSERLAVNGSSQRRVPFWVKKGMHLGVWKEPTGKITIRDDLGGNPHQIYLNGTYNATRLEEKKVVELICAE